MALFHRGDRPCYLHGDLNNDNVLLRRGCWASPFSLLDFSDSLFGHRMYDFVAIHLSVFMCDKNLLNVFLHNYGFDRLPESSSVFAYICFVYTMLSDSPAFKSAVNCVPHLRKCKSLHEMATILFDVAVVVPTPSS